MQLCQEHEILQGDSIQKCLFKKVKKIQKKFKMAANGHKQKKIFEKIEKLLVLKFLGRNKSEVKNFYILKIQPLDKNEVKKSAWNTQNPLRKLGLNISYNFTKFAQQRECFPQQRTVRASQNLANKLWQVKNHLNVCF